MKAALVILDGWGIGRYWPVAGDPLDRADASGRDAVAAAETHTYDRLLETGIVGHLRADGPTVGLPEGQMGNSAVGHLTIGAGLVVEQASTRIERALDAGELRSVSALAGLLDRLDRRGGRLHVWGLASDGGVHGSVDILAGLVTLGVDAGLDPVLHVVTDGRDTHPRCAGRFVGPLTRLVDGLDDASIATVTGRYYAMDRDGNWGRTRRAYEAMAHGLGSRVVSAPGEAVPAGYAVGESDEFLVPTVVAGAPAISDDDGVVMANFRADRARQLTRMLADLDPTWPVPTDPPAASVVTMAEYDRTFDLPVAFPPEEPGTTLGSVVADAGLTQLRIAESEKYPHVTYFLNGGREVRFPGERREIVPSPDVATYDRRPEMSAEAVTDRAIAIIEVEDPDLLVLNYANPDMVGHTGDFDATVAAVEAVDDNLGRLLGALDGVDALVIADHGNAEDMGTPEEPHTAHTTNPVPAILRPGGSSDGGRLRRGGTLADVAPTVLDLLGLELPAGMEGRTLRR